MTKMKKQKKLSMLNVFKGGFSPGSSGREAAKEYKKSKAKKNTEIVFENIRDRLARGKTVTVANFGTFGTRKRASRTAKNPRTGEIIQVKAMDVPFFKASKKLKEKIK
jgi:nucleoid DNA-binding protein